MLSIWIGRAGAGKSRQVLEQMAARRELRSQVLIVPEHVTYEAEMDLCRALGPTASRCAEVLSFHSLGGRVLAREGGLSDFTLDNGGKLLTVRLVLQELHAQLKVFGRPSRRSVFLRQLVELIDELYAYEIAPEALYEQVADVSGDMGDKLRDVALIYAAYDGKLRADGIDRRSRVQRLRDKMAQSDYLQGKDVYFDGFSYFNKAEESVLELLMGQANDVVVTLLGDRKDRDFFHNALRQRRRLEDMACRAGTEVETRWFTEGAEGPLGHLERGIFGPDTPWEGESGEIELYQASTVFTEAEYAARRIRELVRAGYRYREIGVMARNMDEYGPVLEKVFERDGIPAYISRRSDILEKPVMTLLLSAVDAVTGGFEYEDMFRYLKTCLAGIGQRECDLLENYVITWDIRGAMWLRDTPWIDNPDGYGKEMTEARKKRLAQLNAIRQKVRLPLLALSDGLKVNETAKGKAKTLYEFAVILDVPRRLRRKARALWNAGRVQLAEECGQLWDTFCTVLDQFVEILGDTPLEGEEFARLLRLTLGEYSVGTIPATLDQVKVSDITRNDRHTVRCLFLLGANDHVLPRVNTAKGVLSDEARALLQQRQILLSDATFDELDNELQNIYAALAQATERLVVSYPVSGLDGTALEPSFVVRRMEKLFPKLTVRREDLFSRVGSAAAALALAGEEPGGPVWRWLKETGKYDEQLSAMERARAMGRGELSPEAVETLYGSAVSMSASRIDRIRNCHFGFFMEHGLKARERKRAGFDAPQIGTFIHYLLENVTREVMGLGGYPAVAPEEIRRLTDKYIDAYTNLRFPDYAAKSARFRYLYERLRGTALRVMMDMAEELAHSEFQPISLELAFGMGEEGEGQEKLHAITLRERGMKMTVNGKVDRVDGWEKDGKLYLRVVDYKTGKRAFKLGDVQAGLEMQMLLYLFMLKEQGEAYYGKPVVPAGVLYMPARDELLSAQRDITPEGLEKKLRKSLKRTGLLLKEPEVLQAMEHEALSEPHYLPISVKADGDIIGSVATAAQLGQLSRYVERILHQIAGELGNINADPRYENERENACSHCAFRAACHFDESRDRRHYLPSCKDREFWEMLDSEVGREDAHG